MCFLTAWLGFTHTYNTPPPYMCQHLSNGWSYTKPKIYALQSRLWTLCSLWLRCVRALCPCREPAVWSSQPCQPFVFTWALSYCCWGMRPIHQRFIKTQITFSLTAILLSSPTSSLSNSWACPDVTKQFSSMTCHLPVRVDDGKVFWREHYPPGSLVGRNIFSLG